MAPVEIDNQTLRDARTQAQALGDLYEHFHPRIYRYCLHRLLTQSAAEDAASRVFLKVAGGMAEFRGRTLGQFAGWLYRIATNEINSDLRSRQRRRRALEALAQMRQTAMSDVPGLRTDPLDWPRVQQHLLEMSVTDQTYIALRYFEGLCADEIGRIVKRSSAAVRTGLSRAVARLRKRVLASAVADNGR